MIISKLHENFLKCTGVCTDTRSITEGSIFFALKGDSFNGNKYAVDALKMGAQFAVVDEDLGQYDGLIMVQDVLTALQSLANYHRGKLECPVFTIVGSNGKTTTKELLAEVLSKKFNVCATKGNLNNHIGVPLTILSASLNTEFLLVEMGANHQGEIKFLCEIAEPDFGLITNIGLAHLDGFGGLEGVKIGKTELYRYFKNEGGVVFFNNDEESIHEFREGLSAVQEYGVGSNIEVVSTTTNRELLSLKVNIEEECHDVHSQLFGDYNIHNILTALAVGQYFEIAPSLMAIAIEEYVPENNRSQLKTTKRNNALVLDAYNANPTSTRNAVEEFSKVYSGNNYYILGDMLELGEASAVEHAKILTLLNILPGKKLLVGAEYGKHSKAYSDNDNFDFYDTVNLLNVELSNLHLSEVNILIKGSRSIALEKTITEL